jgi:hypothetical protein
MIIPNFNSTRCIGYTVCASGNIDKVKDIIKKEDIACKIEGPKGEYVLRIATGMKDLLFRIDSYFVKNLSEKTVASAKESRDEIEQKLNSLYNIEVNACVCSKHRCQLSELPEKGILRSLLLSEKTGGISYKLTGAKLEIKGAQTRKIEWEIDDDDENYIIIKLVVHHSLTIGDNFLDNIINKAEDQFSIFVLGDNETTA